MPVSYTHLDVYKRQSVFKVITCIEHDGELICNRNRIADTLVAIYAEVSSTGSYFLNFLARKDEVERDLDRL